MRSYEITFESVNSASYSKPITALVIEPDAIDEMRAAYRAEGAARSNLRYGYVHSG